jgi:hypothetical protein
MKYITSVSRMPSMLHNEPRVPHAIACETMNMTAGPGTRYAMNSVAEKRSQCSGVMYRILYRRLGPACRSPAGESRPAHPYCQQGCSIDPIDLFYDDVLNVLS